MREYINAVMPVLSVGFQIGIYVVAVLPVLFVIAYFRPSDMEHLATFLEGVAKWMGTVTACIIMNMRARATACRSSRSEYRSSKERFILEYKQAKDPGTPTP